LSFLSQLPHRHRPVISLIATSPSDTASVPSSPSASRTVAETRSCELNSLFECFKPRGKIHGVADHGIFLAPGRADIARHHFAEVNADADPQRPAAAVVDQLHRGQHLARGFDRMVRGTGRLERRSEQRQEAVAQELVDDTAMASRISTSTAKAPSSRSTTSCGDRERAPAVKLRKSTNMTATRLISLAVLVPSAISRSTTCGDTLLAEQIGDAVARGRGLDAGLELAAQLHAHGPRQHAADQDDHAADNVKGEIGRWLVGELRRPIEHRHREQLGRGNESR